MTKSKLCGIAYTEVDCKKDCNGCSKECPHDKKCKWLGTECNGCAGYKNGCKDPEEMRTHHKPLVSITVGKDAKGNYISKTEVADEVTVSELKTIFKEVLGIVI